MDLFNQFNIYIYDFIVTELQRTDLQRPDLQRTELHSYIVERVT